MYITSVSVLKNFVLVSDMTHSVQLLYWRERDSTLNFVARDYESVVNLGTGFMYDGAKLGMLTTDDDGNFQLFQENPR